MNISDQGTIKVDDDGWEINDDRDEGNTEESIQAHESITIEQMSDAIEEAKKIMLLFVEEYFGEDILNKVSSVIDSLKIGIDRDPKTAKLCSAYYSQEGIFLTENYCKSKMNSIDMIHVIIHEYAHSFSYLLSKNYVNAVVEEAFADIFAEMSINNYIQKGNKINYISANDNDMLSKNNGYYEQTSYISEGEFTRGIMYALKTKDRDMEALREYFFGEKEKFVDICEEILGHRLRVILTEDLANVQNQLGVENNTFLYLPQASRRLKNILGNYFNYPIDENTIRQHGKSREESELYTVEGSLIDSVYFENKLRYEWLKKIDFSSIKRSNAQQIFSDLHVEDIQEISRKSNGKIKESCSKGGYSDFIKLLIRGWYLVNKESPSSFEEIVSLTGSIPYDIFLEILADKEISNINDILHLLAQYHVLNDEDNYLNILGLLNKKVGNEFFKTKYDKQMKNKEDSVFF